MDARAWTLRTMVRLAFLTVRLRLPWVWYRRMAALVRSEFVADGHESGDS